MDIVAEHVVIPFEKVYDVAGEKLDRNEPLIIIGVDKNGEPYVAATHADEDAAELYEQAGKYFD
jgi:hypothetical protein